MNISAEAYLKHFTALVRCAACGKKYRIPTFYIECDLPFPQHNGCSPKKRKKKRGK